MADVYINSNFVGTVEDITHFVDNVKDLRRKGSLPEETNIYYDEKANEVKIMCDEGRARRPLIIVKEGRSLLTPGHLRQNDTKVNTE